MARRIPDDLHANPDIVAIWRAVAALPKGQVTTYGAIARCAGLGRAARQVGYALRIAPRGLQLPWHRVVGAGGRLSLPRDGQAYRQQCRRLAAEGVLVKNGRVRVSEPASLDALLWSH
jgi:methylated-DNA-protein-cysteine methyltransferase-like protein